MRGKRGALSVEKALPVFLICLAVLLALIWVIQLIWVKDGYRILKTQMAKSVCTMSVKMLTALI